MKTKSKITALCVLLFLMSCSDENFLNLSGSNESTKIQLTQEEATSIAFDEAGDIQENDACAILTDFVNALNKPITRSVNPDVRIKVCSKYYVNEDKEVITRSKVTNPLLYEMEVLQSGKRSFAIVSGDERAPKVLVYIPEIVDEKYKNSVDYQMIVALAKQSLIKDVDRVEQIKSEYRAKTIAKISKELGIAESDEIHLCDIADKLIVSGETTRADNNAIQNLPTQVVSYKGPFSKTAWDQEAPYNRELDIKPVDMGFFVEQTNVPAGCGVIALAELMVAVQPQMTVLGTTMDWNALTQTPTLMESIPGQGGGSPAATLNMAGKLIKSIYDATGSYPKWGYNSNSDYCVLGSSTPTTNMCNYIDIYTYHDLARNFDADVVLSSLNQNHPVFMYGPHSTRPAETNGAWSTSIHAFMIDGYAICKKKIRTIVQSYDLYWHANLGWGPDAKAYFNVSQDLNCVIKYSTNFSDNILETKNLTIIPNIRKK